MRKRPTSATSAQPDLFTAAPDALYPVAIDRPEGVTAEDFNRRLSQAVSEAMRISGKSRARIAFEMSEMLDDQVSEHMLNAYAAAGRPEHSIPVARLRALVKVTGQLWLLDVALEGLGVTLLAGHDAIYAQRGLLEAQKRELEARLRDLNARLPVAPATAAIRRR